MKTLVELQNLEGRVAVITGGAGNIGKSIGEALIELGAKVGVLDLDPLTCQETAEELSKIGPGRAFAITTDLANEAATRSCITGLIKDYGKLDILVHSAAFVGTTQFPGWDVTFEKQTLQAWNAAININLSAAFYLTQVCQTALATHGCGSVIFIGSIYGTVGPDLSLYEGTKMANPAGYAASKGGLLQLTRYLACVLAPSIRVNMISPGGMWRDQPEVFCQRYIRRTPLRRMATEDDIKGAVAYLASDLSNYVTGHNLIIDGGWTAW